MLKVLVFAPHPDDEVLGAGGTMAKHAKAGDEVHLCIVTKAYLPDWSEEFIKNRTGEIEEVGEILGVKDICFLDFPTVKLDTIPQKKLNEVISDVVDKIRPDIVYLPHRGDTNMDHRLVFEAAMVALRPASRPYVRKVLSYETLSETEWAAPALGDVFIPNVYADISDMLETKLEAMSAYKSELKDYPHPRSLDGITALARKRGTEACLMAAEAFMLVREVLK